MALSLRTSDHTFEIGSASFLKAFFSTVFVRLEKGQWGSRFPAVMKELYSGLLKAENVAQALAELDQIEKELGSASPSDVVWDFEDRLRQPPWKDRVSKEINSLAKYFVTSDGKNLFDVLRGALKVAAAGKDFVAIE